MPSAENVQLAADLTVQARAAARAARWPEAVRLSRAAVTLNGGNTDAADLLRAALPMLDPATATDEQTGVVYTLRPEDARATSAARLSAAYLLGALTLLAWLLLDTWTQRNALVRHLGFPRSAFNSDTYRLLAFTAIGGGIGAALDGIRANIAWHSERRAYGTAFLWKDLASPWIGATVGVIVYGILRGGVGTVSGDFSLSQSGGATSLVAFSVAAVAGFSWHQVFKWLDVKGNSLFSVTTPAANGAVSITSSDTAIAYVGVPMNHLLVAVGDPHPVVSLSGDLPQGIAFDAVAARLSGSAAPGTGGVYALHVGATNGVPPNASQALSLIVNEAPHFTSEDRATFTIGSASGFAVSAGGWPTPTLAVSGALPGGVSFDASTGWLSGTPTPGSAAEYALTFTAANAGAAHASQSFVLLVQAPAS